MGNSFRWRACDGHHEVLMSGIGPEAYSTDAARDVTLNVLQENGRPGDGGDMSVCCDVAVAGLSGCPCLHRRLYAERNVGET